MNKHTQIYIVGSKGIPASYGGFETFVEELTKRKKDNKIIYHVGCMNEREQKYIYNDAECFNIQTRLRGPLGKMFQVCNALKYVCKDAQKYSGDSVIVYILGCRIGPFLYYYKKRLKKEVDNIQIMVNPDGMEWRRSKWKGWQKAFLKFCERSLVRNADLVIADSMGMQEIIRKEFRVPQEKIKYVAYGAEITVLSEKNEGAETWYKKSGIVPNQYYLIVGRFVPENNYETMISEFMKTNTTRKLVIISNVEENSFYEELKEKTDFLKDDRILFAGTLYDKETLTVIRKNAFAYIHGHEVGGTNPSLLEALATTKVNLLLGVDFNKEVGQDGAIYFNKTEGNLANIIDNIEKMTQQERNLLEKKAKQQIYDHYNWDFIVDEYERVFLGE